MLISDIDYDLSLALTISGRCPVVSHGLHSIRKGSRVCEECGISSCELVARKGEPHAASTGWVNLRTKHNVYLIKGKRGALYITAYLETSDSAIEQYLNE